MSTRLVLLLLAFAPLALLGACTGDDTLTDSGTDAAHDATLDAPKDSTTDAPKDSATDVASDVVAGADASDAGDASAEAEAGSSWHAPVCDGTIGAGEYGGAQYQTTSGSQTWYVTWDATNLYVALDTATLTEANVVYVGFSGAGHTAAQTYDGTGGTLPFPADGVVYAKSGYQEARTGSADAGAWSAANTSAVMFCSAGTTREELIPWTALGATGIPAGFRFLGYATSGAGFVYGQIPTTNPGGSIGTTATFAHDFHVASTANGTGSFPFDVIE